MALESVETCPICSSNQFQEFLTCKDYTTSGETFDLQQCTQCNLVITNPKPDENSIGSYYKSDSYISHSGSKKGIVNSLYLLARKFTLRSKTNLVQHHKSSGSILDYGCGTGEFLFTCKEAGLHISGVEPDADARKKAQELNGKTIVTNLAELKERKFDIITAWHVLEHVADLREKISELKLLLNKNGIILIAVPNHKSFDAITYREHWAAYDVPRHLWHFSKENMESLLREVDLQLIDIKPMKLDSFYVSLLSESYKNPNVNGLIKYFRGFITGLRSNQIAKKTMNYSSLIYIARL